MSLFTVNTGIVNHTHSRMGSIMSTGIVQGMLVLFLNSDQICCIQYSYMGHLFCFKSANSYYLAVAFPLIIKVLQLYMANCYGNSEIYCCIPPFFSRPFPPPSLQELQPSRVRPAAAPTIPSLTSSPWVVLPSQWLHPWPSPPTRCITGAKAPPASPPLCMSSLRN